MTARTLSGRVAAMGTSATMAMTEAAGALREAGVAVCSLSAGEPDFATPAHIVEAAKAALDDGATRYTPAGGTPALREAVAAFVARTRGAPCTPASVMVAPGAKHALFAAFFAVLDPGDEVLVPAPYWVSYPHQVHLAGGVPVVVPASDDMVGALERCATGRTRALVLNSPCNPTGAVLSEDVLRRVVQWAADRGIWVISDEVYREIYFDPAPPASVWSLESGLRDRVVVIDGVSKSHAMTGWRIGWAVGPASLIEAMTKVQGHAVSCACAVSQAAALAALQGPMDFLDGWRRTYARRRDVVLDGLSRIPGLAWTRPQGAFYVLIDVGRYLRPPLEDDGALCRWLLETAHVALVPGSAFGAPGTVRLSFAASQDVLERAMDALRAAFAQLD